MLRSGPVMRAYLKSQSISTTLPAHQIRMFGQWPRTSNYDAVNPPECPFFCCAGLQVGWRQYTARNWVPGWKVDWSSERWSLEQDAAVWVTPWVSHSLKQAAFESHVFNQKKQQPEIDVFFLFSRTGFTSSPTPDKYYVYDNQIMYPIWSNKPAVLTLNLPTPQQCCKHDVKHPYFWSLTYFILKGEVHPEWKWMSWGV